MTRHFRATGSQAVAVDAANEFLLDSGSAVGAVLSGFFADAGVRAGVLLGPLVVIVAGVGNGVRVFDGRLRQPGIGAKRPRGFTGEAAIPDAARVAVPHAIGAAVVAHAYDRTSSFAEVVKRGVREARQRGAEARAEVLHGVQSQGARCLSSPQVARWLMLAAGVSEGGLLTAADLASVPDLDLMARPHPELPTWSEVPWAREEPMRNGEGGDVLCAVDKRGIFAGAVYRCAQDGVVIQELGLEAPRAATPVLRGVPRLTPGIGLSAPVAVAIQVERGVATSIIADTNATFVTPALISAPEFRIERHLETRLISVTEKRGAPADVDGG
jgi:gamma-glutamyltranspeptidase/glutathione hydrolase